MDAPRSNDPAPEERRARSLTRPIVVAAIIIVGLAGLVTALRDSTPRLTPAELWAARARWDGRAHSSYTVDVVKELDRQTPERLRTVVEGGRVTSFAINGARSPTNSDSYTIDGLFDMIERELEMAGGGTTEPGQPRDVSLRAGFDVETGIPLVFKRLAADGKSVIVRVEKLEVAGLGDIIR